MDEICDLYVESLTGLDKTCIDFTSDQVIKLKSDRVYKYTRALYFLAIFSTKKPGLPDMKITIWPLSKCHFILERVYLYTLSDFNFITWSLVKLQMTLLFQKLVK